MKRVLSWLVVFLGLMLPLFVQADEAIDCKVTINFNNEGLNETKEETIECGSSITLPNVDEINVPDKKVFENWKALNNTYEPGEEVVIETDTTFYAKYQNIYTVSFDMNGARGVKPKDKTVKEGTLITPPENVLAYDFELEGWYREKECKNKFEFETDVISEDTTLYAKWVGYVYAYVYDNTNKEVGKGGMIEYNAEGYLNSIVKDSIDIGTNFTLKAKPEKGYRFVGWAAQNYNGEILTTEKTYEFSFDHTRTYYALFEKSLYNEYSVTFNSNGGSVIEEQIVEENTLCPVPEDPKKNGYIFDGWYIDSEYTSKFDFNTPILEDITLNAKWLKDENAVLNTKIDASNSALDFGKFEMNFSREDSDKAIKKIKLTNTGITTIKISEKNPSNVGPFGSYWWDEEALIEPGESVDIELRVSEGSPFASLLGNYIGIYRFLATNISDPNDTYEIEIPAKAVVSKHHIVTFDSKGGTKVESQSIWDKESAVKPINPKMNGYEFARWLDLNGEEFNFNEPITEDITLYATYEKLYNLTYDLNGGSISGEATKIVSQIRQEMTLSYENLMTKIGAKEPKGKALDYVLINDEKYELDSTYLFKEDTTIKYIWKDTLRSITTYNEVDYNLVFDYDYYLSHYSDVANKYKSGDTYDYSKVLAHFANYGLSEGRQGSKDFNVYIYQANYVDLYNKYGQELKPYYLHFINHGFKENREASSLKFAYKRNGSDYSKILDINYYIDQNEDVATRYKTKTGYNYMGVFNQFLNHGMKEGRKSIESFDVYVYQANYCDIYNKYGTDLKSYYLHYMNFGYKENREASVLKFVYLRDDLDYSKVFDINYYIKNNSDVESKFKPRGRYNYMAIFNHFLNHGMDEGRKSSPTFNVKVYKANYKDLQNRFGNEYKPYYIHYINYGYKEKRRAF